MLCHNKANSPLRNINIVDLVIRARCEGRALRYVSLLGADHFLSGGVLKSVKKKLFPKGRWSIGRVRNAMMKGKEGK